MQVEVFWVVTPFGVVVGYQRFGEPCCHLQGEVKMDASWSPRKYHHAPSKPRIRLETSLL